MQFAVGYLLIAGLSIWMLTIVIHRSSAPTYGLAYVRAGLIWSFGLLAFNTLVFVTLRYWAVAPIGAVAAGFAVAAFMLAMT